MYLTIGNMNNENSTCEKLLGGKENNEVNFSEHLDGITKKARRKFSVSCRIFFLGREEKEAF